MSSTSRRVGAPTRVRTWAVKAKRRGAVSLNWHQLSLIAACTHRDVLSLHEGSCQRASRRVSRRSSLSCPPLLILWDNSRPHRSHLVRDYVAPRGRIQLHFLPGYAPELNPVEFLWSWLKRHALANFCPTHSPSCN